MSDFSSSTQHSNCQDKGIPIIRAHEGLDFPRADLRRIIHSRPSNMVSIQILILPGQFVLLFIVYKVLPNTLNR